MYDGHIALLRLLSISDNTHTDTLSQWGTNTAARFDSLLLGSVSAQCTAAAAAAAASELLTTKKQQNVPPFSSFSFSAAAAAADVKCVCSVRFWLSSLGLSGRSVAFAFAFARCRCPRKDRPLFCCTALVPSVSDTDECVGSSSSRRRSCHRINNITECHFLPPSFSHLFTCFLSFCRLFYFYDNRPPSTHTHHLAFNSPRIFGSSLFLLSDD